MSGMPVRGELFIEKLARTRCQPSYLPQSRDRLLAPLAGGIAGGAGGQPHAGGVGQGAAHHGAHPGAALPEGAWHEPGPVAHPAAAGEGAGLAAGEMPVQEIAWRLGYASTSAFIAMFQREQGCAPSAIASNWANPWPEPHEKGAMQAPLWITGWA